MSIILYNRNLRNLLQKYLKKREINKLFNKNSLVQELLVKRVVFFIYVSLIYE